MIECYVGYGAEADDIIVLRRRTGSVTGLLMGGSSGASGSIAHKRGSEGMDEKAKVFVHKRQGGVRSTHSRFNIIR